MKKSTKLITIGLLAASMAACKQQPRHRHQVVGQNGWDDNSYGNSYVDYGYGYNPMTYYYPMWYYPSYGYSGGRIYNSSSAVYHSRGGYHENIGGHSSRVNVSSSGRVSARGGFGSSGHSVSS